MVVLVRFGGVTDLHEDHDTDNEHDVDDDLHHPKVGRDRLVFEHQSDKVDC